MAYTGVNAHPSGETGFLTSPVRLRTAKTECVNFWYHMGGVNPGETPFPALSAHKQWHNQTTYHICVCTSAGSLTLYMKPVKGEKVKIFSDSLNQGDVWRHARANISSGLEDWQVQ